QLLAQAREDLPGLLVVPQARGDPPHQGAKLEAVAVAAAELHQLQGLVEPARRVGVALALAEEMELVQAQAQPELQVRRALEAALGRSQRVQGALLAAERGEGGRLIEEEAALARQGETDHQSMFE